MGDQFVSVNKMGSGSRMNVQMSGAGAGSVTQTAHAALSHSFGNTAQTSCTEKHHKTSTRLIIKNRQQ